jgi:hypothetical protein
MHVRGVDTIFVLSYLHILKKIYLKKLCHRWIWWLITRRLRFFLISLHRCFRNFS